jgi:probable F420-dependent oxidoreductase
MDDVVIGVGLGLFYQGTPTPKDLFRFVERADEIGIDSIWMPDHVISEQPEFDPTVLMAVIAARTSDIKMGPSVMTLPARNPVEVANAYANLDYLTGGRGRVIMAVGLGAEPLLSNAIGIPPDGRADRLREAVEVLRLLWTEDEVSYDGEFYHLDGVSVNPKPAQGPLDIWIGGNSNAALRRVAEYGDGWFPSFMTPSEFAVKHDRFMAYCEREGRVVERDEAGIILLTYVDEDRELALEVRDHFLERRDFDLSRETFEECSAFGTPAECRATLRRYIDAGCPKYVLLPIGPPADRIEQLERLSHDVIQPVTST